LGQRDEDDVIDVNEVVDVIDVDDGRAGSPGTNRIKPVNPNLRRASADPEIPHIPAKARSRPTPYLAVKE
jgi:hypothetical protein